ncbi:TPA: hypothetical protein ACHOZC_003405 [Raoultella ornithinolytica]
MTDITELTQRARINAECGEHLSPTETIELIKTLEKLLHEHNIHVIRLADQRAILKEYRLYTMRLNDELRLLKESIGELESIRAATPSQSHFSEGQVLLAPHIYRELVNDLRDIAQKHAGTGSLREALSRTLSRYIKPLH